MVLHTQAIVGQAPNQAPTIEEITLDEIRPDEGVVEIEAVGICHADVAILQGVIPLPFPRVLGHEGKELVVTHRMPCHPALELTMCSCVCAPRFRCGQRGRFRCHARPTWGQSSPELQSLRAMRQLQPETPQLLRRFRTATLVRSAVGWEHHTEKCRG